MIADGLYEQVINKDLRRELSCATGKKIDSERLDEAEAPKILAKYMESIFKDAFLRLQGKKDALREQIGLVNRLLAAMGQELQEDFSGHMISGEAEQLLALLDVRNTAYALNKKQAPVRPETSIAQSSLFTGAKYEPKLLAEFKKEIVHCDRMDMLVSFVKWSGLRLLMEELKAFTQRGGCLRVITTSYMGATDLKAIRELQTLPNTKIKISYDTKRTRLHAKTYIFYRQTGFTTAYIGSSNLSNAAISSGLEWNVKVTEKELPEVMQKVYATFESYWNSPEFEDYEGGEAELRLGKALRAERLPQAGDENPYTFDIRPYPYQQEILEKLQTERVVQGRYRNLLVAATGTGKTVIAAFDYKRYCQERKGGSQRLLFVAHREEILKQSLHCFRGILKDPNFGELFVGGSRPASLEHLFVSIQTLNSQELLRKTSADFYDYIIVDEFHHAAANTYQEMLDYYSPKILLGLTATPERMDGKSILAYFDHHIAAEIRLPEAINRKLLVPFQYFGVTDTVDLNSLKWDRGGYLVSELTSAYTADAATANRRADRIVQSVQQYVTDVEEVKGIGFCVSIRHVKFMQNYFNAAGIASMGLSSDSSVEERATAKQRLVNGDVKFIFVVDLYNEGVDIPAINTVLFLRPTESLTVFLQQLGRGLRLAENKECLTVLDFIGQANKKYRFENKFEALLEKTNGDIQKEIAKGFSSVPKGCFIQLERKAQEYILANIKKSFAEKAGMVARLKTFEADAERKLTLTAFLEYHHLQLNHIYARWTFADLCVAAGLREPYQADMDTKINSVYQRLCGIDSRRWIQFLLRILDTDTNLPLHEISVEEECLLQMFQFTVWQKPIEECGFDSLWEGIAKIRNCPVVGEECRAILAYKYEHIDFIDEPLLPAAQWPLDLHCAYTRDQSLVALGFMKPASVREGVKYLPEQKIDVLYVTLNKADKEYSPSTMYEDYSINKDLFHWQSQSTTADTSATGQRYMHHKALGNKILLFVRERKKNALGTMPYTCLGFVTYERHTGSRPMNIVWLLQKEIPAKYLRQTNGLVD